MTVQKVLLTTEKSKLLEKQKDKAEIERSVAAKLRIDESKIFIKYDV